MCKNQGRATLLQDGKKFLTPGKSPEKWLRRQDQSASMKALSEGRKIGAEIECIQFQYTDFPLCKHAPKSGSLRIPMASRGAKCRFPEVVTGLQKQKAVSTLEEKVC
jgi:hypothetical protein